MKNSDPNILADQEVVDGVGAKMNRWIDEVSMLQDVVSNCERTGVPLDAQRAEHAHHLLDELEAWRRTLSESPRSSDAKASCEWRIKRALTDVLCREAQDIVHGLTRNQ